MGFCYFLYSGGVVVGLWATPLVAKPLGWQAVYVVYTAIGLAWAVSFFQNQCHNEIESILISLQNAALYNHRLFRRSIILHCYTQGQEELCTLF